MAQFALGLSTRRYRVQLRRYQYAEILKPSGQEWRSTRFSILSRFVHELTATAGFVSRVRQVYLKRR